MGSYTKGQSCGRGHHSFVEQNGYLKCTRCGSSRTVGVIRARGERRRRHRNGESHAERVRAAKKGARK